MNTPAPRENPRISVNKLGEYMNAAPGRRRKIIVDQKYPPTFMVTYYDDAQDAIREFYRMGGRDERLLTTAIERLAARIPDSDYEEQRTNSCIESLAAFHDLLDEFDLSEYTVEAGEPNPAKLVLSGVEISVRPELLLRKDGELVGAAKLHFSKGSPMARTSAEYVAVTVHRYLEEVRGVADADPRACYVVDVFERQFLHAPRSYRRRRQDVEAACEEIASRWSSL